MLGTHIRGAHVPYKLATVTTTTGRAELNRRFGLYTFHGNRSQPSTELDRTHLHLLNQVAASMELDRNCYDSMYVALYVYVWCSILPYLCMKFIYYV